MTFILNALNKIIPDHATHNHAIQDYFSQDDNESAKRSLATQLGCKKCTQFIEKQFQELMKEAPNVQVKISLLERLWVINHTSQQIKALSALLTKHIKRNSNQDAMLEACYVGNLDLAMAFHENGVDLNVKTLNTRFTLLHYASHGGFLPLTTWLLENNQNLAVDLEKTAGDLDRSPLHLACANGKPKVVARLIRAGADLKALDKSGSTPLHLAFSRQDGKQNSFLSCARLGLYVFSMGAKASVRNAHGHRAIDCILKPLQSERIEQIKSKMNEIQGQEDQTELKKEQLNRILEEIVSEQFFYLEHAFSKFECTKSQYGPFSRDIWPVIMRHSAGDFKLEQLRLVCKTFNNLVVESIIHDLHIQSI